MGDVPLEQSLGQLDRNEGRDIGGDIKGNDAALIFADLSGDPTTEFEVIGTAKADVMRLATVTGAASPSSANSAPGGTGEVVFNSGGLLAANGAFFWDNATVSLGVGTSTPDDGKIEVNRAKFYNNGPVYLGTDGSAPTGTAPDIFLSGDTVDWHTNKGLVAIVAPLGHGHVN